MRMLMFGRGAISTIYGRVLAAAGHDVEFYVRPGRAAEYGGEVRLDWIDGRRSMLGRRVREEHPVRLRESLDPSDGYDLVVLSVGHHRLAEAAAFLAPRLGAATVLVFGNVWGEPLEAVAPLPAAQVVFGFPGGGGQFQEDGLLVAAIMTSVVVGTGRGATSRPEQVVLSALRQADIAVREEKDIRGWLWLHFIADAGMYAQAVSKGSLSAMAGDRQALQKAFATTRELLPLLRARGVDLGQHRRATLPYRFPLLMGTATGWATALVPIARRALAAHTDPDMVEGRAVVSDTLREARRLGIPAPRLET
jgi:2-dehydropantoate 2-reductase